MTITLYKVQNSAYANNFSLFFYFYMLRNIILPNIYKVFLGVTISSFFLEIFKNYTTYLGYNSFNLNLKNYNTTSNINTDNFLSSVNYMFQDLTFVDPVIRDQLSLTDHFAVLSSYTLRSLSSIYKSTNFNDNPLFFFLTDVFAKLPLKMFYFGYKAFTCNVVKMEVNYTTTFLKLIYEVAVAEAFFNPHVQKEVKNLIDNYIPKSETVNDVYAKSLNHIPHIPNLFLDAAKIFLFLEVSFLYLPIKISTKIAGLGASMEILNFLSKKENWPVTANTTTVNVNLQESNISKISEDLPLKILQNKSDIAKNITIEIVNQSLSQNQDLKNDSNFNKNISNNTSNDTYINDNNDFELIIDL